jgi:hypothetical protein
VYIENVEGVPLNATVLTVGKERYNETWWRIWANVSEVKNVTMIIRKVKLWAVNATAMRSNVNEIYNQIPGSNCTSDTAFALELNETKACESLFEYPEVIVAYGTIADLTFADTPDQVVKENYAREDPVRGYGYVEDVFVVNSYTVRVTKYVNETGVKGQYNITVELKNIGTQPTPQKQTPPADLLLAFCRLCV